MPSSPRTFFGLVLALYLLGPRAASAQWGYSGGGRRSDTQYVMDENGNYTGQKNRVTGDHTDGNRYACTPITGGMSCNPCGNCHTAADVASPTYTARFDGRRHLTVHLPRLEKKLQPNEQVDWGERAVLAVRSTGELVARTRTKPTRDLVIFPAGARVYLNQKGVASFVVLPREGPEPVAVKAN